MQSERGRPARSGRAHKVMVRFARRWRWSLNSAAEAVGDDDHILAAHGEHRPRGRHVADGRVALGAQLVAELGAAVSVVA